jgi:hypothetical protein
VWCFAFLLDYFQPSIQSQHNFEISAPEKGNLLTLAAALELGFPFHANT